MPTLDEVINKLQVVREVLKTGDVDVAIATPGPDGFTTLYLNVMEPMRLKETGELAVIIGCMPKLPEPLWEIDLSNTPPKINP